MTQAIATPDRWHQMVPVKNPDIEETVFVYARVSTKEQVHRARDTSEGFSIPAQKDACRAFAERYGWKVTGVYAELGATGRNLNRPEMQRMLADIKIQRPSYVLAYDLSRLSRREIDSLNLLYELREYDTMIRSVTEPFDYGPNGRFLFSNYISNHSFRSRGDGSKVVVGMDRKHASGGTNGAAPAGYRNIKEIINGGRISTVEIDPEYGPLMRLAFELMESGDYSINTALKAVTEAGLRTRPTPARPSKPLTRSAFARALRNPYYVGIVRRKGLSVPGQHEPLISQETFDRVQANLDANRQGGLRTTYTPHYLAGGLYCAKCSRRLGWASHRSRSGDYYAYFSCLSRCHEGACGAAYISERYVEDMVEHIHGQPWLSDREADALRKAFADNVAVKGDVAAKEIARRERKLLELKNQQQKLVQLFYSDAISEDVLKDEQSRIRHEQEDVERWKREATRDASKITAAAEEAIQLLTLPEQAYRSADSRVRRMINFALFERVELWLRPDEDAYDDVAGEIDWDVDLTEHVVLQKHGLHTGQLTSRARLTGVLAQMRTLARALVGPPQPALALVGGSQVVPRGALDTSKSPRWT
jgi:DNA invertase Pin-like site-specific DNA recombinase